LDATVTRAIGTGLWILTVASYVLASLGFLGVPVLQPMSQPLTMAASITSLFLLVLFWHLWLVLGIVVDVALLVWVMRT
jgi:hypothetical protein